MTADRPTKPLFALSATAMTRVATARFRLTRPRTGEGSDHVEAEIAVWVNEGGAGGEVRR